MNVPARVHVIALALAAAVALARAGELCAQVSPGPLATAHQSVDGSLQCFRCHAQAGSKAGMSERCLVCHTEVAWMRDHQRGTHAAPAVRQQMCATCHPDHGGRDFQLIAWDNGTPEKFDHARAGFILKGKHAALECVTCHKTELQKSPATALIRVTPRSRSWLGLETACVSCHKDPHRAQLGTACERCHGPSAWKPASGFDHAKTRYPLTGAHAQVACAKCHPTPAPATAHGAQSSPLAVTHGAPTAPATQWKPVPHAECASCHRDAHDGRFGAACSKCHVTTGFKVLNPKSFDHSRTRYPLRGAHAAVACASCHDPKLAWGAKPKFDQCSNCHRDAHAGTATVAGQPADCATCHEVRGFRPSTFSVAQHQQSPYPLMGRHAQAECRLCHARASNAAAASALGSARVALRPAHSACVDCHVNPHGDRFLAAKAAKGAARECVACHSMNAFHPSTYDAVAHRQCVFPLEGAHRAIPCQACHTELRVPPGRSSLLAAAHEARPLHFDNPRRACADCHASPHGDQFAGRRDHGACEACHGSEAFVPATVFRHDRDAAFKLTGAHTRVACAECHPAATDASGKRVVRYRPVPSRCIDCHAGGTPGPGAPHSSSMSAVPKFRDAVGLFGFRGERRALVH